MTHHTIITGKVPGQPGGCKAQHYLNSTFLNGQHHSQLSPTPQSPFPAQNQYGTPTWQPSTGSSYPFSY